MDREALDTIRSLLEGGDTASAVAAMLDTITALMDEVDTLNVQLSTLLETMDDGEEDDYLSDECSYIVTCSACECVMEVESWLLEEEDAELSCPQCGAILEL